MKFTKAKKAEFEFLHHAALNSQLIENIWRAGKDKRLVAAALEPFLTPHLKKLERARR
jgi:DNA polymerase III psi subunit